MKPSKTFSIDRLVVLKKFLAGFGLNTVEPQFLAGDASARTYYRISGADKNYVLMDAPAPIDCWPFIKVDKLLLDNGFSAPVIMGVNTEDGFLLLEDFGDLTYSKCLENGQKPESLYTLAVKNLTTLHSKVTIKPDWCETYTPDILWQEIELYASWYWPKIMQQQCGDVDALREICYELAQQALLAPQRLILRDYHVDNLMLLPHRRGVQQCGLLDFQDAIWGPVVFDFVSLVEDARRDVSNHLTQQLWKQFLDDYPIAQRDMIYQSGIILSTFRHMKILGVFTRLAYRDGKQQYLMHVPRLLRLLGRCLNEKFMWKLKSWFERNHSELLRL